MGAEDQNIRLLKKKLTVLPGACPKCGEKEGWVQIRVVNPYDTDNGSRGDNILEGLLVTDPKMLELASVYQMKASKRFQYIYLPSVSSHVKSAISLAIGMAFRGGITAEVVGQPLRSIGNGLYRSKINLATSDMLAWTFVAVLSAFVIEKLISFIVKKVLK